MRILTKSESQQVPYEDGQSDPLINFLRKAKTPQESNDFSGLYKSLNLRISFFINQQDGIRRSLARMSSVLGSPIHCKMYSGKTRVWQLEHEGHFYVVFYNLKGISFEAITKTNPSLENVNSFMLSLGRQFNLPVSASDNFRDLM